MPDALKVPEALAGFGFQCEKRVGEKVVARPVAAVEIGGSGTGWNIDDATGFIHSHAGPIVGGAGVSPGIGGPGVVTEFAGVGNGMELPAQFAGAHIESANIAWRRRQRFRGAPADDEDVFVDYARSGQNHRRLLRIAPKALAQIDAPGLAEGLDGLAGFGIKCVDETVHRGEEAAFGSVRPPREAAVWTAAGETGIERPEQFSRRGVQRDRLVFRRDGVKHAVHFDWLGLRIAPAIVSIEGPGDFEARNIGAVDVLQCGVAEAFVAAPISGPIIGGVGGETHNHEEQKTPHRFSPGSL